MLSNSISLKMNLNNENKIQLYHEQIQLQKQLKSKKDDLATVKRSYSRNKKTAQEQMELIKQLLEKQNKYHEIISIPPPESDPKVSQYHQYNHLIKDLEKSYQEVEEDSELAFPFDEDISPNIDHYSDLYSQLNDWLKHKESMMEENDEQQKNIIIEIEKLKKQNNQIKEQLDNEPTDLSEQINEIKKTIKERKPLLNSKEEIIYAYKKKKEELDFISDSINESQNKRNEENDESENSEMTDIKINKEVNVKSLNKIQLECLEKWEQLRNYQVERQNHENEMKELADLFMNTFNT